jgi:hypothetical protein
MDRLRRYSVPTDENIRIGAKSIQECIRTAIQTQKPFFIGRNGSTELQLLYYYITHRANMKESYPEGLRHAIHIYSGIFPGDNASLDEWCKTYFESLGELDGTAAGWYEPLFSVELALLHKFTRPECFQTPLRSLEPYYSSSNLWWTKELRGQAICVVSSFTDTIQHQMDSGASALIWRGERAGLLDIEGATWSYVKCGYAPNVALGRGGWPPEIKSWKDAVDKLERDIVATGSTVALIGCGALGVILGARLKRRGISAIILGGAIQVLFGIKGKRWQTHDVISKFWNPFWVWPAASEVPGAATFVEGGCYWGNGTT